MLVEAPPVAVTFAELQWPDGWDLPWVGAAARDAAEALAQEYGQPFYTNKDGKVNGINERYWAALYARENRVLFDPDEKTFYRYAEETGLWETITPESIREIISGRILEISREAQAVHAGNPDHANTAQRGGVGAQGHCRAARRVSR